MVRFEYPLVLLIIPVLIGVLYFVSRHKNLISFILRCIILVLVVFVLAGLEIKIKPANLCRIYVVDTSGSIFLDKNRMIEAIKDNIKLLDKNDKWEIIYFGRNPVYENRQVVNMSLIPSADASGTNIEKALSYATGFFHSGYYREIFLFTDGNETEGDAKKVIPFLKDKNISLYTIPIGPKEVQDIKISYLEMPKIVRENQPVELKCRISSTINTSANLQVYRDNILIEELKDITLLQNQDNIIVVSLPFQTKPIQIYEVRVFTDEFNAQRNGVPMNIGEITMENNYGRAVVQKIGKPKILYLSGAEDSSQRTILRIIGSNPDGLSKGATTGSRQTVSGQDFDIETLSFSNLQGQTKIPFVRLYDVIIIDNLSLTSPPDQPSVRAGIPNEIKSFVSNGGGLLAVGGENSFGSGGYQNSQLEDVLPVWATPPEDLSIVIILDASGSMDEPSGVTGKKKFQVASDALENAISLLGKKDRLEVITFNQGFETTIPLRCYDTERPASEGIGTLQSLERNVSLLKEKLSKIKPTGPTAIIPPIQKAITTLTNILSAKKHIILLSDGHSTTNESLDGFHQMAEKLQENNITISTIATGEYINEETLKALTKNETHGKVYRFSGKEMDEITKNLRHDLSVSKEFYREADNLSVQAHIKDDILKGIDNVPPISGYNRTTLKPNARLVASVSKDREVLIADWHYGLGKTMVLNTSFDSKWMGELEKWGSLAQLVTQGLRYITPALSKENTPTKITAEQLSDGTIKLAIEIPVDQLNLFAYIEPIFAITSTNMTPVKIPQVAVGKYEVILDVDNKDDSIISVFSDYALRSATHSTSKDNTRQLISRIPIVMQYPKEWQKFTPDTVSLRNLAEATDGKLITADALKNEKIRNISTEDTSRTYHRINTILIILVLVLFITDLVVSLYRR
ncbi:MAG: VWA domain-containing protein [Planctomycetota bacterium]